MGIGFWNTFKTTFAPRLEKAAAIMNGDFAAAKGINGGAKGVPGHLQRAAQIMNGYSGGQRHETMPKDIDTYAVLDEREAREKSFKDLQNKGFKKVYPHDVIEPMFPTVRDI
jgi:hypothetical protein